MPSPQDAALRHRLNSIRAIIQSFDADLGTASPFARADIELLISFFRDAEKTAKNEIELHELTHGGIEARKRACAHPERFITNAPAPPITIFDRTPPRPRRSREEQIATKKAELESELKKAEARSSELEKAISDWYLCALAEWDAVTATARSRWNAGQRLAIEQYGALKLHSEHLPSSQGSGKLQEVQKGENVSPRPTTDSIQAWKTIEKDYTLRLSIVAPEWATEHQRAWNEVFAEGRKRGNPAYKGPALVEMEIADADKRAEWSFQTCCEIWDIQGRTKSKLFFQAVFDWSLQPMFSIRESCFRHQLDLYRKRAGTGFPQGLSAIGGEMKRRMDKLRAKWCAKLEIATRDNDSKQQSARSLELQHTRTYETEAGRLVVVPTDNLPGGVSYVDPRGRGIENRPVQKRGPRPQKPCYEGAATILRATPRLDLRTFCMKIDAKAEQNPNSPRYQPPNGWKVRSFLDQYEKRPNTVAGFVCRVRKILSAEPTE